jgi:8-oxo-dGTP pyrophosphatase MutT (NUDIX family)
VLLIQRHQDSRVAGGDYVFPGGKIEADDNPPDAARWCAGLDPAAAARRLGLGADERAALGYLVGAIRETFEEVGILLATDADGRPLRVEAARFADYRRACDADNRAFWAMVKAEKLVLATDRLTYFAHWITPEESAARFDVRFFAAAAPAGQAAVADEREIVEVCWLTPREAILANTRGGNLAPEPDGEEPRIAGRRRRRLGRLGGGDAPRAGRTRGPHHPPPGGHGGGPAAHPHARRRGVVVRAD